MYVINFISLNESRPDFDPYYIIHEINIRTKTTKYGFGYEYRKACVTNHNA